MLRLLAGRIMIHATRLSAYELKPPAAQTSTHYSASQAVKHGTQTIRRSKALGGRQAARYAKPAGLGHQCGAGGRHSRPDDRHRPQPTQPPSPARSAAAIQERLMHLTKVR